MLSVDTEVSGAPQIAPWFALRVKSNFERVCALHLHQRGYDEFLPVYRIDRRWSDRIKKTEQVLFPGYVFCRMDPNDRLPVLTIPGVIGLVGIGKMPIQVDEHEIQAIRTMIASGCPLAPWPFLKSGQRVLIDRGPLAGIEGLLLEVKRSFRIVVSISLLQRSVAAELDADWVQPIASTSGRTVAA